MERENVYVDLQRHLDKQAVGFPATKSGVELRILEELFTPEQAVMALSITYRPQTLEEIFNNAGETFNSIEEAQQLIDGMLDNGSIGVTETDGIDRYYHMPLLIGIIEQHSSKASSQFSENTTKYFRQGFGRAFLGTKVSQMRTIPVGKSIPTGYMVSTYDHVKELIRNDAGPFAINPCMCREGAKRKGNPCKVTTRSDTCMSLGDWAKFSIKNGTAREISWEEALEILTLNQDDGLVLQPTNYQNPDFICSCCGDCCGVLTIMKRLPKPAGSWAHNFYAEVDAESCVGCGICVDRCQMGAVKVSDESGCAEINLDRCFGCGNCVVTCPSEAIQLIKIQEEIAPPESRLDLYAILAEERNT